VPSLLERLGVEPPVVQAGMGGGISRHELAAAVSEAGGLGTIAVNGAEGIRRELAAARALTGRPLAVNLLLPFARRDWFEAAGAADVVVTFWGEPRRRTGGAWLHQCGSVAEAKAAQAAGADGVIVQSVEAGGHVRGTTPGLQLLEEARRVLPPEYPVLLAGGIAERDDVRAALEAGAHAAVAGTRFLLAEESTLYIRSGCWERKRRSSPSSSAPAGPHRTGSSRTRRPNAGANRRASTGSSTTCSRRAHATRRLGCSCG
jgi:NAD(P)H-dependent flavin oxidoreductase YrpB (nitropropane dioxygenase family)